MHEEMPVPGASVPAGQKLHDVEPAEEELPASQSWQAELLLAPASKEYLPSLHFVHESEMLPASA